MISPQLKIEEAAHSYLFTNGYNRVYKMYVGFGLNLLMMDILVLQYLSCFYLSIFGAQLVHYLNYDAVFYLDTYVRVQRK